jgi:acetyl esterase/lipase
MKKFVLLIMGFVTLFQFSDAQTEIALWPGKAPFLKDGVETQEINENNRVSKVSRPALYHYPSTISADAKAAVIIVPGGGYIREAIDHEGWMPAQWFAQRGIEAFVLKYRLPDEALFDNASMVPLMDAQHAIALVRSQAAVFGIDPHKIGIIGFSAGGHLAASASNLFALPADNTQKPQNIRPDFSILIYPVITMDTLFTHMGSRENLIGQNPSDELVQLFSLENQVSEQTPVTFMVHALNDKAVPIENSNRYAQNLFEKGGDVTKIILPDGGHGFGFRDNSPVSWWTQYLEVWLRIKNLSK